MQRKIIKQMEKEGWMVIKIIRANMAGLPDLLLLRDGVARWVEVKQPGKKPTVLQSARHALLRRMGFSVEVMDGTKQAESMKAIGKRYSQVVPPDSRVYVTVCAGCEKDVFGWTPQQADVAWKEHECKTPKHEVHKSR